MVGNQSTYRHNSNESIHLGNFPLRSLSRQFNPKHWTYAPGIPYPSFSFIYIYIYLWVTLFSGPLHYTHIPSLFSSATSFQKWMYLFRKNMLLGGGWRKMQLPWPPENPPTVAPTWSLNHLQLQHLTHTTNPGPPPTMLPSFLQASLRMPFLLTSRLSASILHLSSLIIFTPLSLPLFFFLSL